MVILVSMFPRTVKASHRFVVNTYGTFDCHIFSMKRQSFTGKILHSTSVLKTAPTCTIVRLEDEFKIKSMLVKGAVDENPGELSEEDDDLCPAECVKEFKTDEEFARILDKAKKTKSLVVVDFYRTSCGSCKYIEQGFSKLCKGSGEEEAPVIFLKHNVIDEYDEQSEVAERLRIKTVPLFHFYKDGALLESFATRDKERIDEAIRRYTSPVPPES